MVKVTGDQVGCRVADHATSHREPMACPATPLRPWQDLGPEVLDYLRLHSDTSPGAEISLTLRERQCLTLVAHGCSDTVIAAVLRLSRCTVVSHLKNARIELNAKTRAQAVARLLVLLPPDTSSKFERGEG